VNSPGRRREGSRSGWIAALLLLTLVLAGILAWQAQTSMRDHCATAEKVLRDYAMLAADELARRTVNALGFYGFYPLVTAIRQTAASGTLPAPSDLRASRDENLRPAVDLVRATFRYDPGTRRLETLGPEPNAETRAWMTGAIAADRAAPARDRRYATAHGSVDGVLHSIVFGTTDRTPGSPVAGFEAQTSAFSIRFRSALAKGPLFPPSLAHGAVQNDVLFLRILDPAGREIFRAGTPKDLDLSVRRPFGDDYNGILSGFVILAAIDPAAARSLVIGGLPRSRLPFLLGLLALTAGLILTAGMQLRRERAISELRSDFVSRVSHELRTPLTQIRMFAETLVLDRVRSDEERRRSLVIIDRESRRLTHLVENVLRFSRAERGQDRVDLTAIDVVPLARQLLTDFEPLVGGRATLSARLPEAAVALADEAAVRQILLNLLDNAVKYGPAGQQILIEIENRPGEVQISVEDAGPGIPVRERERVWNRFYRISRDRESAVAGTGIGLSVVRDLTRLQGGVAEIADGKTGGARVVIRLTAGPEVSRLTSEPETA
jgi:signal transduction histidine kinase